MSDTQKHYVSPSGLVARDNFRLARHTPATPLLALFFAAGVECSPIPEDPTEPGNGCSRPGCCKGGRTSRKHSGSKYRCANVGAGGASFASSCVRSAIITDERFLHFQLRQDIRRHRTPLKS